MKGNAYMCSAVTQYKCVVVINVWYAFEIRIFPSNSNSCNCIMLCTYTQIFRKKSLDFCKKQTILNKKKLPWIIFHEMDMKRMRTHAQTTLSSWTSLMCIPYCTGTGWLPSPKIVRSWVSTTNNAQLRSLPCRH